MINRGAKMNRFYRVALLLTIAAVLGAPSRSFPWPIPDTGQTQCYSYDWESDTWSEGPCPQSGEALYGQDGNYLINAPSYTKLDENGNDLADSATSWAMVRDNVTGLIWEVKTDDGSIHDKDNTYIWYNAQNVFIAALNNTEFGGHSDWRIPTIAELTCIVDYARYRPAINTAYFPNTASYYWSSTTSAYSTGNAWVVDFDYGIDMWYDKSGSHYVRAVRGEQSGSLDHWVTNGDGTVTDTSLGLMWQQATQDGKVWQQALSDCESLSLADYTDWRLPTIKELRSIVDYARYSPAINTAYFPNTASRYWSSTTSADSTVCAWRVNFSYGTPYWNRKSDNYYVRAVRGGQHWLLGHLFISTPRQGSAWKIGDSMPISWETQGIAGGAQISISRQGGKDGTFETIEENTENDGTYNWTVTGPGSVNCVLKIEPLQYSSKGTSQGLFSIYGPPTATTGSASGIGGNTATLNGTVNPGCISTAVVFEWGADETYGNEITAAQSPLTGGGAQNVSGTLDGLTFGTTYHYRVKATNSAGTGYGANVPFTTAEPAPIVEIQSGNGPRGKETTLPIILYNIADTGIAAITIDVGYDPVVFNKPKASIGPAGSAVQKTIATNEVSPGLFRITVFSTSNNNAIGDGVIAYLTVTILSNAPTNSSVLTCTPSGSDPTGGALVMEGKDGTVTILGNMVGDCNGDGNVSIGELQSAINMYLGILPVLDCVDVNGDGNVSIAEVQKVINNHLSLTAAAQLASLGEGDPISFNASLGNGIPSLDLGAATGSPEATVTVPLTLTNASGYQVSAVSTDITYDARYLESPSAIIGPAGAAAGKDVIFNIISSGTIRVGVFSAGNNNAIGNGVVAYVSFKIKSSASIGQTILGNTPSGSDSSGNDILMDGSDGSVTVTFSSYIYVSSDGNCGTKTPCYRRIQDAIDDAATGSVIMVKQGTYPESISLGSDKTLLVKGGYNSTYDQQTANTTFIQALGQTTIQAPSGSLKFEMLTIKPPQ